MVGKGFEAKQVFTLLFRGQDTIKICRGMQHINPGHVLEFIASFFHPENAAGFRLIFHGDIGEWRAYFDNQVIIDGAFPFNGEFLTVVEEGYRYSLRLHLQGQGVNRGNGKNSKRKAGREPQAADSRKKR